MALFMLLTCPDAGNATEPWFLGTPTNLVA
jgi:hypothetical protein